MQRLLINRLMLVIKHELKAIIQHISERKINNMYQIA